MPAHTTIQVHFIDATTGQPIGEAELSAEQLPPTFEASTTLKLGGKSYDVVSAQPMTAAEYRKTGKLRLTLREVKVSTVNPRDILYSLPTLCEQLPSIAEGSTKLGKNVLELHEDDWRQVELVALSFESSIEAELKAIERIFTQHRKSPGFDALHIRKELPTPLQGSWLTLADLRSALGETASWLDGVSFQGVAGVVAGGFAVKLPSGLTVYGTEKEGRVSTLALRPTKLGAAAEGDARLLSALAIRHQLCLVDWCRVEQVPPTAERLRTWLSKQG